MKKKKLPGPLLRGEGFGGELGRPCQAGSRWCLKTETENRNPTPGWVAVFFGQSFDLKPHETLKNYFLTVLTPFFKKKFVLCTERSFLWGGGFGWGKVLVGWTPQGWAMRLKKNPFPATFAEIIGKEGTGLGFKHWGRPLDTWCPPLSIPIRLQKSASTAECMPTTPTAKHAHREKRGNANHHPCGLNSCSRPQHRRHACTVYCPSAQVTAPCTSVGLPPSQESDCVAAFLGRGDAFHTTFSHGHRVHLSPLGCSFVAP